MLKILLLISTRLSIRNNSFEAIAEDAINNQVTTVINDQVGSDTPAGPEDTVTVSLVGPANVIEGQATTDYTVTLSEAVPAGNSVTVNLSYSGTAIDGTDFVGVTSVVVNGPANTATFTLATIDDVLAEGAESIVVDIDSIVDTNNSFEAIAEDAVNNQVTTVINDEALADVVTVSLNGPASVTEGAVTTDYTLTLSDPVPAGNSVTVNLSYSGTAIDGADFNGVASVIINGPANSATFTLTTLIDGLVEGAENIIVDIDSIVDANNSFEAIAEDAVNNQVTTVINDADVAVLSIADVTVNEADGTASFNVTLSAATAAAFTVDYDFTDGSATGGVDFDNATGTLAFAGAANEVQTIVVPITDDALVEGTETFVVSLNNSSNPLVDISATATATIIDNDSATIDPGTDDLVVPENLLNLNLPQDRTEQPSASINSLRAPNIVIDTVESVDANVFGDQINTVASASIGGLPEQSSISRFVFRSVIAEVGNNDLNSLFPLRVGEAEGNLEDQDQLLLSSLVINDTLTVDVEFINNSGFAVSEIIVSQANGEALPEWLAFDQGAAALIGEPPPEVDRVEVKVMVRLGDGTEIVRYVEINVKNGEISELNQIEGLSMLGIQPFSSQIESVANQFTQSADQLAKLVL